MNFKGYRYPKDLILLSVRWYLRYSLSYRDLEEILAERGLGPDHTTVYRWARKFTPELVKKFNRRKMSVGERWRLDETYIKICGQWRYLLVPSGQGASKTAAEHQSHSRLGLLEFV